MDKKHLNSADHLRRFSRARVGVPSTKVFVKKWGTDASGLRVPVEFSRPLTDADVRESLVRKFH